MKLYESCENIRNLLLKIFLHGEEKGTAYLASILNVCLYINCCATCGAGAAAGPAAGQGAPRGQDQQLAGRLRQVGRPLAAPVPGLTTPPPPTSQPGQLFVPQVRACAL